MELTLFLKVNSNNFGVSKLQLRKDFHFLLAFSFVCSGISEQSFLINVYQYHFTTLI